MCDLEQRVNIVEIDLPETKDLGGFRMMGREVDGVILAAK
jgi:hypothetical protein